MFSLPFGLPYFRLPVLPSHTRPFFPPLSQHPARTRILILCMVEGLISISSPPPPPPSPPAPSARRSLSIHHQGSKHVSLACSKLSPLETFNNRLGATRPRENYLREYYYGLPGPLPSTPGRSRPSLVLMGPCYAFVIIFLIFMYCAKYRASVCIIIVSCMLEFEGI